MSTNNTGKSFSSKRLDLNSDAATEWIRDKLQKMPHVGKSPITKAKKTPSLIKPGRIYFFGYNPKYRMTMPFYDQFPLVLVLNLQQGGFLGVNVHYLPLNNRAAFLNGMLKYVSSPVYTQDSDARILLEYPKMVSSFKKYAVPCIKSYLYSGVAGGVVQIHPADWKNTILMPLDRFAKMNREQVWKAVQVK